MQEQQDLQNLNYRKKQAGTAQRIGIFSGVFDPIHKGHISFALAALLNADLDEVYFLVEAKPRRKQDVTHIAHRLAMAKLAIRAHPHLHVLEVPDKQFSVGKTLPRLRKILGNERLFFMCGTDMLLRMPDWPLIDSFVGSVGLIVAKRRGTKNQELKSAMSKLPKAREVIFIDSPDPELSSSKIRRAIILNRPGPGLLGSTEKYIKENWLYALPSASSSAS